MELILLLVMLLVVVIAFIYTTYQNYLTIKKYEELTKNDDDLIYKYQLQIKAMNDLLAEFDKVLYRNNYNNTDNKIKKLKELVLDAKQTNSIN